MPRTTIKAAHAPAAIGPYSHAAAPAGSRILYLSGQTPIDPQTGALVGRDVDGQTRQVFTNLRTILAAADGTLDDVVKVNVYLVDMGDFDQMNRVYGTFFAEPHPARTTVAVAGLPLGARVEIEVVASLGA